MTFSQTLANKEQQLAYEQAVEACRQAYSILPNLIDERRYQRSYTLSAHLKDTITKLEEVIRLADEGNTS